MVQEWQLGVHQVRVFGASALIMHLFQQPPPADRYVAQASQSLCRRKSVVDVNDYQVSSLACPQSLLSPPNDETENSHSRILY